MLNLSPLELVVIALVVVLLFGTRRLPELGSGLGQAISNFRKSYKDGMTLDVTPEKEALDQKPGSVVTETGKGEKVKSGE